jgi:hypothetical protein
MKMPKPAWMLKPAEQWSMSSHFHKQHHQWCCCRLKLSKPLSHAHNFQLKNSSELGIISE